MADVKQAGTGKTPATNPMNLTCQTVNTTGNGAAATEFAVVIDKDGNAQPPKDGTWTEVFKSSGKYHIKDDKGKVDFDIPPRGLGIYKK